MCNIVIKAKKNDTWYLNNEKNGEMISVSNRFPTRSPKCFFVMKVIISRNSFNPLTARGFTCVQINHGVPFLFDSPYAIAPAIKIPKCVATEGLHHILFYPSVFAPYSQPSPYFLLGVD